jgi:hypothetical protein
MALYYIDSFGSDTELLVKGLAQTLKLAAASEYQHAAVASHTRSQLARSNIWPEAIGKDAQKKLAKGELIIGGCTLYLLTQKIDPPNFVRGPIFAYASIQSFLQKLLCHPRATDVVYVPWTPQGLETFKRYNRTAISF